ncbi:MAG: homoserine kinase [Nitrososphaerales archaeon]
MKDLITARAPSSTANIGPGFDVFGLALDAFYDKVTLELAKTSSLQIEVRGEYGSTIPLQTENNSAGLVVKKMLEEYKIENGMKIMIEKGVPTGFGLGSSAASAVGAAIACNAMFSLNLDRNSLVRHAAMGEVATAGTMHYDNVSASLLGGFVIVRIEPLDVVRIDAPEDLALCIAIPRIDVPHKKTEVARRVLPAQASLKQLTSNVANACTMVAGFILGDVNLISSAINDAIVEPARMHLIPGYEEVKKNALDAGALAVTISGAGPSMIAFTKVQQDTEKICRAMEEGFKNSAVDGKAIVCKPSDGAKVI